MRLHEIGALTNQSQLQVWLLCTGFHYHREMTNCRNWGLGWASNPLDFGAVFKPLVLILWEPHLSFFPGRVVKMERIQSSQVFLTQVHTNPDRNEREGFEGCG
jgi:hypothetical protein